MKALVFTAIIHLLACAPSVWAGDTGSHETILVQALIAHAAGDCPASLMALGLKMDCHRQLPAFQDTLIKLGALQATHFRGMRSLDSGPAELYEVSFEHGAMDWIISTQDDGRIRELWAPKEPTWNNGSFSPRTPALNRVDPPPRAPQ